MENFNPITEFFIMWNLQADIFIVLLSAYTLFKLRRFKDIPVDKKFRASINRYKKINTIMLCFFTPLTIGSIARFYFYFF